MEDESGREVRGVERGEKVRGRVGTIFVECGLRRAFGNLLAAGVGDVLMQCS